MKPKCYMVIICAGVFDSDYININIIVIIISYNNSKVNVKVMLIRRYLPHPLGKNCGTM